MRIGVTLILGLLVALPLAAEPLADGPYVAQERDGTLRARWIEEGDGSAPAVREKPVSFGEQLAVPAVGELPGFAVQLRDPARGEAAASSAPRNEIQLARGTPLFVVADTHGQFEIFVELLQAQRILDRRLRWNFGRGHLVLLGDVFDRGPNHTEILWLIYQLEAEAKRAGGGVHLVLGNHEVMVLRGDLRYLHPKYPQAAALLGAGSYAQLFAPDSLLGQWLRTKPVVLKINEFLCLHGGISRAVVERGLTLADMNGSVLAALNTALPQAGPEQAQFVMGKLGPLWYRGYFDDEKDVPTATSQDIDLIQQRFGVRTILVGHTKVDSVTPLYDGRVIAVQVYPRRDEITGAPVMEAVRIENGKVLRARADGTIEPLGRR